VGAFELLRSENLSGDRTRSCYKISQSPVDLSKKVMGLSEFGIDKIRLTIDGEEMQPDKKVLITSVVELLSIHEKCSISSCSFKGTYGGENVEMVVDYGLKMFNIVTEDSSIIQSIIKDLEG